MLKVPKFSYTIAAFVIVIIAINGCAIFKVGLDLPPLLAQDEIVRPFNKIAVVQVKRER